MDTKETCHTVHIIIWVSVLSRFSEKSTPDTHFIDHRHFSEKTLPDFLAVTVTIHINPLSPNIHKQILQTDLYTFL